MHCPGSAKLPSLVHRNGSVGVGPIVVTSIVVDGMVGVVVSGVVGGVVGGVVVGAVVGASVELGRVVSPGPTYQLRRPS